MDATTTITHLQTLYLLYQKIEKLKKFIQKKPCKSKCQIAKKDCPKRKISSYKLRHLIEKIKVEYTKDDKNQILHLEVLLKDIFGN